MTDFTSSHSDSLPVLSCLGFAIALFVHLVECLQFEIHAPAVAHVLVLESIKCFGEISISEVSLVGPEVLCSVR